MTARKPERAMPTSERGLVDWGRTEQLTRVVNDRKRMCADKINR